MRSEDYHFNPQSPNHPSNFVHQYSSRKKGLSSYEPYQSYKERMYLETKPIYDSYNDSENPRTDKYRTNDYTSAESKSYKRSNNLRNTINVSNYDSQLSRIRSKFRKNTADFVYQKDGGSRYDYDRGKNYNSYESQKYGNMLSPPVSSKYDLSSSSVSAYTTVNYNSQKSRYLQYDKDPILARSNISQRYDDQNSDHRKSPSFKNEKETLKQKYVNYFTPSTSNRSDPQDSRSLNTYSQSSYQSKNIQLMPHKPSFEKEYSTISVKIQNPLNHYSTKNKPEDRENDKYKVSSFDTTLTENEEKRFDKKKYVEEIKLKFQQASQLLAQSKASQAKLKAQCLIQEPVYNVREPVQKIKFSTSIHDFQLGKSKGEGKFGTVYPALHKASKSLYAIKKIPKQIIKSHMLQSQLALQIKLQMYIDHPNVIKMYGFFDDWQNVYIILQYMEEGTLFQFLKKRQNKLSQKQVIKKIKEVTSAVKYLHDMDIAHRDIKPENIVLSNGVAKICDFGWATICNDRRKTYCGTFDYAAPEILQGKEYDWCVDLWCLGILTFQLLNGKAPFYHISRKQTMKKILRVDREDVEFPKEMSFKAKDFVGSLLKKDPQHRIRAQNLLQHPFLCQQK